MKKVTKYLMMLGLLLTAANKVSAQTPTGVKAIDLGLPSGTRWANMNVGATAPEGLGLFFAWGETVGYGNDSSDGRSFDWQSYKWCNSTATSLTKYCSNGNYGTVDNKSVLELEDDAAHVNWGESWRMPTYTEIQELCDNTDYEVTIVNGMRGVKFTSRTNGNSVFMPTPGLRKDSRIEYEPGERGYYWSSTPTSSNGANFLDVHPTYRDPAITNYHYRYHGMSIRPVSNSGSTAIRTLNSNDSTVNVIKKYVKDGVIVIEKSGRKYNIAGVSMK